MKKRDFIVENEKVQAYYPGSSIFMYEIIMAPIDKECIYSFPRNLLINAMRKRSGLCALVNSDAVKGKRGSAAMIDYINAEQLHGGMDKKFIYGSVDAVRSRIRNIEEICRDFAKEAMDKGKKFHVYEAGSGFLRVPLFILESLANDENELDLVYIGAEKEPSVVLTASRIAEFNNVSDKIKVNQGDALELLLEIDEKFDLILAEGAMEYWEQESCKAFALESYKHLKKRGKFVATATHVIPKRKIAKLLDFYFEPKSENEFREIFIDAGFTEPILIKTKPENISIGIGTK